MSYPRYRQPSPDGKYFDDPMRASTGNMIAGTHLDPYVIPRAAHNGYYSSSVAGDPYLESSYRNYYYPRRSPRPAEDRAVEVQPISSRTYRLTDQPTTTRTGYAIRPRSNTSSIADPSRRPLGVPIPSSPNRLYAGYDGGRPPRPLSYYAMNDQDRYIVPASPLSSRHRRIVSSDDRRGRLAPDDKEAVARMDRGGYLVAGRGSRSGYPVPAPMTKPQEIDVIDSYSYTNPTEQFYRDFEATQDYRRHSRGRRKGRPLSLTGLEHYLPQIPRSSRETGPPPSARGFDKIAGGETRRSSSRAGENNIVSPSSNVPQRKSRAPVSLHQHRDETSKHRGEYGDYRHPQDSRRYEDDVSSMKNDISSEKSREDARYRQVPRLDTNLNDTESMPIPTGLATAGLASGYSKELRATARENDAGVRPNERRVRDPARISRPNQRDEVHSGSETDERSSGGEKGKRRYKITEHRARDAPGSETDEHSSDREKRKYRYKSSEHRRRYSSGSETYESSLDRAKRRHRYKTSERRSQDASGSETDERSLGGEKRRYRYKASERRPRDRPEEDPEARRGYHADYDSRRRNEHPQQQSNWLLPDDSMVSTPIDISDERHRRPSNTEPNRPKEPQQPPKGILKPPRDKFPEDRTAVREGVAPLKDATRKGIPAGARWTKVDRKFVSPSALEGERFEERPDYIIILRVVTEDEIRQFAKKTKAIREARYEAYLRDRRRRRRDDDDYSDEEDSKPRLAIESPPDAKSPPDARRRSPPDPHPSEPHKHRAPPT